MNDEKLILKMVAEEAASVRDIITNQGALALEFEDHLSQVNAPDSIREYGEYWREAQLPLLIKINKLSQSLEELAGKKGQTHE